MKKSTDFPPPPLPATPRTTNKAGRCLWRICLVASLGGILFGFDTAVISGTVEQVRVQYSLTALMEGWFTSSALVGCIFGAAMAGFFGDRYGRKPALIVAALLFLFSGFFSTIPPTFNLLVIARLACGLGVGLASVIAPMYISEFAPAKWRGRMVGLYQLFIVIGILLAYLSNWLLLRFAQAAPAALIGSESLHRILVTEYWRGMFAAEMLPAILFLLLLLWVPESPRWLIEKGDVSLGLQILTQVGDPQTARIEMESIKSGSSRQQDGSLAELFRPGLRRALLVAVMLSVFGQLSGVNIVVYYGPKILMAAGYPTVGALLGQVGFGLINLIFTIIALCLIDSWGRRPLLIGGMAVVTLTMAAIGLLFLAAHPNTSALANSSGAVTVPKTIGLWIGIMICLYMACIALSICAVIWVVTAEIFPNRLRGRAASIATFANWSTNALGALAFPWYVAKLGMYSFFFTTAAICLLATLFFWKYLPETKGRSLEEIENLWTHRS